MQEEERERRDNYCPDVSEVKTSGVEIDKTTMEMLKSIGLENLPGIVYNAPQEEQQTRAPQRRKNQDKPQKKNIPK
jgi:small subunit ribosomal protein S17e